MKHNNNIWSIFKYFKIYSKRRYVFFQVVNNLEPDELSLSCWFSNLNLTNCNSFLESNWNPLSLSLIDIQVFNLCAFFCYYFNNHNHKSLLGSAFSSSPCWTWCGEKSCMFYPRYVLFPLWLGPKVSFLLRLFLNKGPIDRFVHVFGSIA